MATTKNMRRSVNFRSVLRGTTPGQMQSVGLMQVIPLLSEQDMDGYAAPTTAEMETVSYGAMRFANSCRETLIIPCHAGYMVRQKAQNHAMGHLGLVAGRTSRTYDTAMCTQESQEGYITRDQHRLMILPFSLREKALQVRVEKSFDKLWSDLKTLNRRFGLKSKGHLEYFLDHFAVELDRFVAEFESVPDQVGAIILINGEVAGVERAPSRKYWLDIWQPLIRECYGSLAIETGRMAQKDGVVCPNTRVSLPASVTSLAKLEKVLLQADKVEEKRVRRIVHDLLDHPFAEKIDSMEGLDSFEDLAVATLTNNRFTGQVVRERERVVYASLTACRSWLQKRAWEQQTDAFSI